MLLPKFDWLVIWKIYHYPWFFWMYVVIGGFVRIFVLPRLNATSPIRTWFVSTAASLLIVPAMPFLVLPAFAMVALAVGKSAVYSLPMALPIALSAGIFGGLIDGVVLRLLLRKELGSREMWSLLGTNLLISLAAVGGLVALMLARPPQIIAMVVG